MDNLILSEILNEIIVDNYNRTLINSDLDILIRPTYSVMSNTKLRQFEIDSYISLLNKINYLEEKTAETGECSICICEIIPEDKVYLLRCSHKFHTKCLRKWNKNTCPYCRSEIL